MQEQSIWKEKNIWINDDLFEKMLDQIETHDHKKLNKFWEWLKKDAKLDPNEVSENGFYFSVVSRCLILHGYGEPFLDKYLIKRLEACKKRNIPTYFSCTPATMTVEKAVKAMEAGLTVLKFSLDAMDEEKLNQLEEKKLHILSQSIKFTNFLKLKKNEVLRLC